MKKLLITTAAIVALSTPAFAQTINAGQSGLGYNASDNVMVAGSNNGGSATGGAGGAGGNASTGPIDNRSSGGSATATGIGGIGNQFGGDGGSVLASGNSTNTNTNAQGQLQGQMQGQVASSNQGQSLSNSNSLSQGNTQTVGGQSSTNNASHTSANTSNVTVEGDNIPRQVASAQAPIVVNVASCAIGGSVAGQGPGFGFALGGARIDRACDVRANAQILFQLGEKEAAVLLMSAANKDINAAVTQARTRK